MTWHIAAGVTRKSWASSSCDLPTTTVVHEESRRFGEFLERTPTIDRLDHIQGALVPVAPLIADVDERAGFLVVVPLAFPPRDASRL